MKAVKILSDKQFDELMEHLQGTRLTQSEGMEQCGFKGMKLTEEQRQFKKENYKRCRKCKTWIAIDEICNC
jgi:hypothetical protein